MDVDIDLPLTFDPSKLFDWSRASMLNSSKPGVLLPHPCGYHPQNIPVDTITGLSAIPYKDAEAEGFYKLDFLHLHIYDYFQTREEIDQLVEEEPDWNLLLIPSVQAKLFQLSNHGDVLDLVKPKSVQELADCLALIRPGKKSLAKLYPKHKEATRKALYAKDETGYAFKKSHALAYALVLVLQLHLISAQLI